MSWNKLRGVASLAVIAGGLSSVITFFSPRNDIPVVGSLGRGILSSVPVGLGRVHDGDLLSEAYYAHMDVDAEYRLKMLTASDAEVAAMSSSERPARNAYLQAQTAAVNRLRESSAALKAAKAGHEQARQELTITNAYQSAGVAAAEEYALSQGSGAILVSEADEMVGSLAIDHNLINVDQMTALAKVITLKSAFGSAKIMSRPEYASVKQDPAYIGLPVEARKKLDELLLPKLGQ